MTRISYVITLYNKQDYIRPVLDSVLAQAGDFEKEVILINDGSTDNTLPLIEQYADTNPCVKIITLENSGPAIATNVGIDAATGEFIKFVDGDDVLCLNATQLLLTALTESNCGLAHSLIEQVDVQSQHFQQPAANTTPHTLVINPNALSSMIEMARFNLSCVLVKTSIAKKIGGCDIRFFIQDYSFCLRASRITNFVQVPIVLAYAPSESENRVSDFGAGAQVLHDLNMALGFLLSDHPDLPAKMQTKIVRRATGRAWRWAKRRERKSIFCREFLSYLLAKVGKFNSKPDQAVFTSCETFRRTTRIRFPREPRAR